MNMSIDIGIPESDRKDTVTGLSRLLADTYTLYLKTQNFHWNITGPMFHSLHAMFEGQYNELAIAVDTIAERIRALGSKTPASYAAFTKLKSIDEEVGHPNAKEMVKQLVLGQEAVIRLARSLYETVNSSNDEATMDLLTERIEVHEKAAWMLRSMIEE